ncbi:hypothetical protein [Endozoicomonas numazuensis]|uniref:Uncharacterized protein n=1 Tax=Endozoicomonas numazuensis TaxID=1137799 RepID=A0A081NCS9_9GAMM|nr:hypothetical protein [Endozoicomonas numazuensis]KEQ16252.1 hypothetical protein GZ78_23850 [Endozoicomonas numazuensis]
MQAVAPQPSPVPTRPKLHLPLIKELLPGVCYLELRGKDLYSNDLTQFYQTGRDTKKLSSYIVKLLEVDDSQLVDLSTMPLSQWMELTATEEKFETQIQSFLKARVSLERCMIGSYMERDPKLKEAFLQHDKELKELMYTAQDIRSYTRHLPALAQKVESLWKADHQEESFPSKAFTEDCYQGFCETPPTVTEARKKMMFTCPSSINSWAAKEQRVRIPQRKRLEDILTIKKGSVLGRVLSEELKSMLGLEEAPLFLQFLPSEAVKDIVRQCSFKDAMEGLNIQHGKYPHLIHLFCLARGDKLTKPVLDLILKLGIWNSFFDRSVMREDIVLGDSEPASEKGTRVKGFTRVMSGANPHNLSRMLANAELSEALQDLRARGKQDILPVILKDWLGISMKPGESLDQKLDETIRQLEVLETYIRDSLFGSLDKIAGRHPELLAELGLLDKGGEFSGDDLLVFGLFNQGDSTNDDPIVKVAMEKAVRCYKDGHRVLLPDSTGKTLVEATSEDQIRSTRGAVVFKKRQWDL